MSTTTSSPTCRAICRRKYAKSEPAAPLPTTATLEPSSRRRSVVDGVRASASEVARLDKPYLLEPLHERLKQFEASIVRGAAAGGGNRLCLNGQVYFSRGIMQPQEHPRTS